MQKINEQEKAIEVFDSNEEENQSWNILNLQIVW